MPKPFDATLKDLAVIDPGGFLSELDSPPPLPVRLLNVDLSEPDLQWSPWVALPVVLLLGALIGLFHGLLITKLRLPAFVVTLCGLFIYRGAARWFAGDRVWGLGTQHQELKDFFNRGDLLHLPTYFWIFVALLAVATVFMHLSVFGRYFFAIGSNERAARYSGIATDFYKIAAYVMCSTLVAFFAFLYVCWWLFIRRLWKRGVNPPSMRAIVSSGCPERPPDAATRR